MDEFINSIKNRKILIAFDDMIADVRSNKKLYPLVTKLFIGTFCFKHFSYYFYIQSYFGFLLFSKIMGKNIGKKMIKNLSGKSSQKLLDHAKQFTTDSVKTA